MDPNTLIRREHVLIGLFGVFSFIFSLYTVKAYQVAQYARGSLWNTGGAGTFFPWPKEPGHLMVITEMSPLDALFNQFFIETGLLAICSLGIWCFFLYLFYRIAKNPNPAI